MTNFKGKYKVINFNWGYIIATFNTLREAKLFISKKGMRCDHKRGSTDLYAAY